MDEPVSFTEMAKETSEQLIKHQALRNLIERLPDKGEPCSDPVDMDQYVKDFGAPWKAKYVEFSEEERKKLAPKALRVDNPFYKK